MRRPPWMTRRLWLGWGAGLVASSASAQSSTSPSTPLSTPGLTPPGTPPARPRVLPGQPLRFPRDHGAHPDHRTEWWYITGHLRPDGATAHPGFGFQITFFRTRVDEAEGNPSALAARQLLMAHVALTDLQGRQLLHDQRLLRAGLGLADAAEADTRVHLRDWRLHREARNTPHGAGSRYVADLPTRPFGLQLTMDSTQPVLLQGPDGYSRKGPVPEEASRYYSQPQLQVRGQLRLNGMPQPVQGLAWMDHEWSEGYLPAEAVGWDWLGINLRDGGSLMLFRMRNAAGQAVWAGGSWRRADGTVQRFSPEQLRFEPLAHWRSPATGALYPVHWRLHTPLGRLTLKARLQAQELDGQASTGAVYWEGLSDLLDEGGQPLGLGYLEMTGYVRPLRMR